MAACCVQRRWVSGLHGRSRKAAGDTHIVVPLCIPHSNGEPRPLDKVAGDPVAPVGARASVEADRTRLGEVDLVKEMIHAMFLVVKGAIRVLQ